MFTITCDSKLKRNRHIECSMCWQQKRCGIYRQFTLTQPYSFFNLLRVCFFFSFSIRSVRCLQLNLLFFSRHRHLICLQFEMGEQIPLQRPTHHRSLFLYKLDIHVSVWNSAKSTLFVQSQVKYTKATAATATAATTTTTTTPQITQKK